MEQVFSFPRIGKYTEVFMQMFKSLELNVLPPPPITDRTVKLGVKHSADMMCYPFKVTLGNFIEEIEQGANCLIMYDSRGKCRLRHYWVLHELILRRIGYDFKMYPLSLRNLLKLIKRFNPNLSYFTIVRKLRESWERLKEVEDSPLLTIKEGVNIGIVGEIYTCLEPAVNLNIEKKLKKFGVNVYNTVRLSDFIKASTRTSLLEKRSYKKEAERYLNGPLGGHGFENLYNTLFLCNKGIDGIIHLLPLSCMPETTIEPILDKICNDYNVPLLRLMVDETNSEVNFDTRIETFSEMIKRRKK
jgi:predicted nucleotide-binding protein (sugar kinase/HSP70/actin superfamily)